MPAIFITPAQFPGGTAGNFAADLDTHRSLTSWIALGTRAVDPTNGNQYVYVKAGAAIAQFDAVAFQGSALGYDDVRPVSAANQPVLGVAQAAFASAAFGWILVKGRGSVKTSGSVAANASLVSSATAGTLGVYAGTETALPGGVSLVSSASPQVALISGILA
jgi:hypothetical protein